MLGVNPAFASRSGDPLMEKGEKYVVRNMHATSRSPSKPYWNLKVFYSFMLEVNYASYLSGLKLVCVFSATCTFYTLAL